MRHIELVNVPDTVSAQFDLPITELPRSAITANRSIDIHRFTGPLAERYPLAFQLFSQMSMDPRPGATVIPLLNPYTEEVTDESFVNIGVHSVTVGLVAARIAEALCEADVLSLEDAEVIVERALLHDILKPFEIFRKNSEKGGSPEAVYSRAAYEMASPYLVNMGIEEDLVQYLMHAGSETGHNSLKNFLAPDWSLLPGKLAEGIVHLADDMVTTTNPASGSIFDVKTYIDTPEERMLGSNFRDKYEWLWKKGLRIRENGVFEEFVPIPTAQGEREPVVRLSPIQNSYAILQVYVSELIARQLKLCIDPTTQQRPTAFLRDLVNHSLS